MDKKKGVIIFAVVCIALLAVNSYNIMSVWGLNEIPISAYNLSIDKGEWQNFAGYQRINQFDPDGGLKYLGSPGHYHGYRYPTITLETGYLSTEPELIDLFNITSGEELTQVGLWEYKMYAEINLNAKTDIITGSTAAFEGHTQVPAGGKIFDWDAYVNLKIDKNNVDGAVYGISWVQIDDIEIDWGGWKTIDADGRNVVGMQPTMNVYTVGTVYGEETSSSSLLGKELNNEIIIKISGQARSGCYEYYDPNAPGRLYNYVVCNPSAKIILKVHVAAERTLYLEAGEDPENIDPPTPPVPASASGIDYILIIIIGVLTTVFLVLFVPRILKAYWGRRR